MKNTVLTGNGVYSAVDDNSAGFDPITFDKFGNANGHHKNISTAALEWPSVNSLKYERLLHYLINTMNKSTYHFWQILGLGMANSNRGVIPFQQFRNWCADNFATTQDNSPSSGNWYTAALDQFNAAVRSARNETGQITNGRTSFVLCMQSMRIIRQA